MTNKITSSLEFTDAQSAAAAKTDNRVTLASMQNKIDTTEYIWPEACPHMTIAVMTMKNGYAVIGKYAPEDPANFNLDLCMKFAREDAIRQLWPLEGYALCETLNQPEIVGDTPD